MDRHSKSERETAEIAAALAGFLKPGDAVCLQGKLGAGKSVFARALIRTLCGKPGLDVPSPTFTLAQIYESPRGTVWHFDLYRLQTAEEVYELGWEEAASGIALIEWPERLGALAPADRLDILFATSGPDERILTFAPRGNWKDRPLS